MVRLVLFDIDGTLIRSGGAGVKAFGRAFASEFGLVDGTERLKFAGRTDRSLVREFFSLHQIQPTPEHYERFFASYLVCLRQTIVESAGEICPGVEGFMKDLASLPNAPLLGLLTGNIRQGARIKLEQFQLWSPFSFGAFADDHENRNCLAAIARKRGCDLLNSHLKGEEVLVIGDTPHDVRCARAIDAKVLAVATGGTSLQELQAHAPDWAVAEIHQVAVRDLCA